MRYQVLKLAILVIVTLSLITSYNNVFSAQMLTNPNGISVSGDKGKDEQVDGKYAVYRNYPLNKRVHGIDGFLQLLQDVRLTEAHRSAMWGTGLGDDACSSKSMISENDELLKPFKTVPLMGTGIRIIDKEERITESKHYRCVSLANMEEVKLYDSERPTYLLTLDESQGWGSYNGLITYFVEVVGGRLKWLEFIDKRTGKKEQMALLSSLKTAWKIVPSKNRRGKNILRAACRPNWDKPIKSSVMTVDDDFEISYARFHFNGRDWVRFERKKWGIWEFESESDFPDRSHFP